MVARDHQRLREYRNADAEACNAAIIHRKAVLACVHEKGERERAANTRRMLRETENEERECG